MDEPRPRRRIRAAVRITGVGDAGSRSTGGAESTGELGRCELGSRTAAIVTGGHEAEVAGLDAYFLERPFGLDPYPILGAVADRTTAVVLGCLAAPAGERSPAVLAKIVTSLDVVARGRAVLGLGGRQVGDGDLAPNDVAVLRDALEICRAMARVPAPSFGGTSYVIDTAWNEPRYREVGPLPIVLLVDGDVVSRSDEATAALLALGARFAEHCAVEVGTVLATGGRRVALDTGDTGEWQGDALRVRFDAACLDAGRPPGEVGLLAVVGRGGPGWTVVEIVERAAGWLAAGYDGVIADLELSELGEPRVKELMGALARMGSWAV